MRRLLPSSAVAMWVLSLSILLITPSANGQRFDLPIRIMTENRFIESQLDPAYVQSIVTKVLQSQQDSQDYLAVDVFMLEAETEQSPVLLAYLKFRHSLGIRIVRISLDQVHKVSFVEWDVTLKPT